MEKGLIMPLFWLISSLKRGESKEIAFRFSYCKNICYCLKGRYHNVDSTRSAVEPGKFTRARSPGRQTKQKCERPLLQDLKAQPPPVNL